MLSLYSRLSNVGLTRPYVKTTALPEWWDDSIADNPAGYAEALLHLSRHLGLSLTSLQNDAGPLTLRDFGPCKFKKQSGTTDDDLGLARAIGTRTAQLAATATPGPYKPLPASAAEVRLAILDGGVSWVGLRSLLDYCWSVGVPVVFLTRLPKTAKKMHGMSAVFNGRPVIVLSRNAKPTAWLLFVLAHELGHIACGHLADGTVLLDQDVNKNERDPEEEQANAFAIELLSGRSDFRVVPAGRWPNATDLAESAKELAARLRIDPGHVVLNYAHTMGKEFWPVATAALKRIDPHGDGPALVKKKMAADLDWSALPKDSCRFLMQVTEAEPTE